MRQMEDRSHPASTPNQPRHRVHVVAWLRRPADRLLIRHWLAITVGSTIVAWRPLSAAELAHELEHVRQWQRHGLRFVPRYLRASWRAWRSGADPYRDNVFEARARSAAAGVSRPQPGGSPSPADPGTMPR